MEKMHALMEIDEARQVICELLHPRPAVSLALAETLGNVIARSLLAPFDFPAFDQSAMDGYALASLHGGPHPLLEESCPPNLESKSPRGARRVATGFPLPDWACCVVPQENCIVDADAVQVEAGFQLESDLHIRRRGGAFAAGTEVLPSGTVVTPGVIGLASSCGCAELPVRQPVRALHVATGSELITPPTAPQIGKVYDSNGPMIAALLADRRISCERTMTGDDAALLRKTLEDFTGGLLLISGGSGPGEQDHTARALTESGYQIHISGVRSRPGKPLIFATRGEQVAFGLPGNPLSQWVCFQVFVRTALDRWNDLPLAGLVSAVCEEWQQPRGDGRPSWTPAVVRHIDGRTCVQPILWKHSGDLLPLARATALLFGEPDPATKQIPTLLL